MYVGATEGNDNLTTIRKERRSTTRGRGRGERSRFVDGEDERERAIDLSSIVLPDHVLRALDRSLADPGRSSPP